LARRGEEFMGTAGLPTTLSACGVSGGILPVLAGEASHQWTGRVKPRPGTEADLLHLYEAALGAAGRMGMTARGRGLAARSGLCLVLMVVYDVAFFCPAVEVSLFPAGTMEGWGAFRYTGAMVLEPSEWLKHWLAVIGWAPNLLYWAGIALL